MSRQAIATLPGHPATAGDVVAEPGAEGGRAALPVRGADLKRHAARVRPYAITGGRTRSGHVLLVETLIAAVDTPSDQTAGAAVPEESAIVSLCGSMRSVAEISALLRMPLGVVRVLLSDLADQGRIRVYGTGHGPGAPNRALLERVLSGLRRL
jgi:Protein of unknown function (DUF742)